MKLIAHIGQGKTGSSSIQKTLKNNSATLGEAGVFYLGLNMEFSPLKRYEWQKASTWNMLIAMDKRDAIKQLCHILHQSLIRLEAQGYKKLIWSNESLLKNSHIVIPALKAIKKRGFDIDVIIYLRRHDSWMRSAYLQWAIKHKKAQGVVKPFSQWRDSTLNYSKLLKPWRDEKWNKLFIRNYDACEDLISDFISCCEIGNEGIVSERANDTPEKVALNLWALFNSQREQSVLPNELQGLLTSTGVIDKKYHKVNLAKLYPTRLDLEQVLQACQADIAAVNAIFSESEQPLFDNEPLKKKEYHVDHEQMIAALLDMIRSQHEGISKLEQRMTKLEQLAKLKRKSFK